MAKEATIDDFPMLAGMMKRYRANEMDANEIKTFFQHLIDNYDLEKLPGELERTSRTLIAMGACKPKAE